MYRFFMFALDLDELDVLSKKWLLLSRNRFGVFQFRDRDHLHFGGNSLREGIGLYLKEQGIVENPAKVVLVTNLRFLGHIFNPVSFYFCYDGSGNPFAAVAEVGNTFGEMKAYLLGPKTWTGEAFDLRIPKLFYVSPFTALDAGFHFRLQVPGDTLSIQIDDFKQTSDGDKTFFVGRLWGNRKKLSDLRLFGWAFRFPFVTVQILASIHFQAFLLWVKKTPFIRKADHPELQRGVRKPGVSL